MGYVGLKAIHGGARGFEHLFGEKIIQGSAHQIADLLHALVHGFDPHAGALTKLS